MRLLLILHTTLWACLLLAGCGHEPPMPGGTSPVDAVARLNTHLVNNDLAAFAHTALPPELHAQVTNAWQAGHTRWPLDELPLSAQYPRALAALGADNADSDLMAIFDRQLAGADHDIQQSALLLSMFMAQLIQQQNAEIYSESVRAHYSQLIAAAGQWAATAPLADRDRADQALGLLISAAREAGLNSETAFTEAGMGNALQRMTPVLASVKQVFALYGLNFNTLLADAQLNLLSQNDNAAEVELRYKLGEHDITAIIPVQRIAGRWYVTEFIRHAESASGVGNSVQSELMQ